jgi:hypothetical protein
MLGGWWGWSASKMGSRTEVSRKMGGEAAEETKGGMEGGVNAGHRGGG